MSQAKLELSHELETLKSALRHLQALAQDVPWANWKAVYDPIGVRHDQVKAVLESL